MKIEIILDKADAILECVNVEESAKSVKDGMMDQIYNKLYDELYTKEWEDYCDGNIQRGMFNIITDNFILIPRNKKWSEFFSAKTIESINMEL